MDSIHLSRISQQTDTQERAQKAQWECQLGPATYGTLQPANPQTQFGVQHVIYPADQKKICSRALIWVSAWAQAQIYSTLDSTACGTSCDMRKKCEFPHNWRWTLISPS